MAWTIVAFALILAAPAQSSAEEPEWKSGMWQMLDDWGCFNYHTVMVATTAWYQENPPKLPQVGDVFYTRVRAAAPGAPCMEGPQQVGIEMVLPNGLELAISSANPVKCALYDIGEMSETPITTAQGCPTGPTGPGLSGYGLRFDNMAAPDAPFWPVVEGEGIIIMVPVRATRTMTVLTPELSCEDGMPCPPDAAGDNLQFGVILAYSGRWMTPFKGLSVEAFASGQYDDPPKTMRIGQFVRRGLPFRFVTNRGPATITLVMTARGLGKIARVQQTGLAPGPHKVTLRPTRKAARALAKVRRVKTSLTLTIASRGYETQSSNPIPLTLKR